jgi:benzodiazapine receptor
MIVHMAGWILIPLTTVAVAVIGSLATREGMSWYRKLRVPSWTPPGSVIGAVWTALYVLATASALLVYAAPSAHPLVWPLFVLNAVLNALWSYVFFWAHQLWLAVAEAAVLALSVLALIIVIWPVSPLASLLLVPYFLWTCFATLLASRIAALQS